MYVFLGKRQAKDLYFIDVYFMGAKFSVSVNKNTYDKTDLNPGDLIPEDSIDINYFNKGYDVVCRMSFK